MLEDPPDAQVGGNKRCIGQIKMTILSNNYKEQTF